MKYVDIVKMNLDFNLEELFSTGLIRSSLQEVAYEEKC